MDCMIIQRNVTRSVEQKNIDETYSVDDKDVKNLLDCTAKGLRENFTEDKNTLRMRLAQGSYA